MPDGGLNYTWRRKLVYDRVGHHGNWLSLAEHCVNLLSSIQRTNMHGEANRILPNLNTAITGLNVLNVHLNTAITGLQVLNVHMK